MHQTQFVRFLKPHNGFLAGDVVPYHPRAARSLLDDHLVEYVTRGDYYAHLVVSDWSLRARDMFRLDERT